MDDLLFDYQKIDHDIAVRLVELDHPWRDGDSNVGGGRSSIISKPQEEIVLRHEGDIRLQYLYRLKDDCERAIARFDDEQFKIYQLRYCADNYYDWDTVGHLIGYGHSAIYRKRYAILKILAQERGSI